MLPLLSSESLRPRLLSKFNVSPNNDDVYDDDFEKDNPAKKCKKCHCVWTKDLLRYYGYFQADVERDLMLFKFMVLQL